MSYPGPGGPGSNLTRRNAQAERAVEALTAYLPNRAKVVRDGREQVVEAARLVPGDVLMLEEGDRIPADARLIDGGLEVDLSALTALPDGIEAALPAR